MWKACSPGGIPRSETLSNTPAGTCVKETVPTSPIGLLSTATAESAVDWAAAWWVTRIARNQARPRVLAQVRTGIIRSSQFLFHSFWSRRARHSSHTLGPPAQVCDRSWYCAYTIATNRAKRMASAIQTLTRILCPIFLQNGGFLGLSF